MKLLHGLITNCRGGGGDREDETGISLDTPGLYKSYCIAYVGLQLTAMLLPQPSKYWSNSCESVLPAPITRFLKSLFKRKNKKQKNNVRIIKNKVTKLRSHLEVLEGEC